MKWIIELSVDIAGDLGVMVERSNSPFVFCNPGSQWTSQSTKTTEVPELLDMRLISMNASSWKPGFL